jgi:hypothetical protein
MQIAYNFKMTTHGIQARLSNAQWSLKPQDIAIAFKLVCLGGLSIPYAALAKAMHLSVFEAHSCVARLSNARLITSIDGLQKIVLPAFGPLIQHGAPYFFPAVKGGVTVGMPTAYAVSPIKEQMLLSDDLPPVWPHPDGDVRGTSLLPLYANLPLAAREDAKLYELLALFDALRIGQAREREVVKGLLALRLSSSDGSN